MIAAEIASSRARSEAGTTLQWSRGVIAAEMPPLQPLEEPGESWTNASASADAGRDRRLLVPVGGNLDTYVDSSVVKEQLRAARRRRCQRDALACARRASEYTVSAAVAVCERAPEALHGVPSTF